MTLKFYPPKKSARYGLFVGNESDPDNGSFKTFDNLTSAKLSYHFANNRRNRFPDAKILENINGEWFVLHDIKGVTSYKELPWVKEVSRGWRHQYSSFPRAVPMTRDEYAEWRVAVEREQQKIYSVQ